MRHPRDRTVYSFHLQFVRFLFPFEMFSKEKQRIRRLTNFKISLFDQRIKVNIKLETLRCVWFYKLLTRWYYKIENIGGWKRKTRTLLVRSVRPIISISRGGSQSGDSSWCTVAKTPVHMSNNLRSVGLKIVEKRWQNPVSRARRVDELIGLHECIPALIVAFLGHDT